MLIAFIMSQSPLKSGSPVPSCDFGCNSWLSVSIPSKVEVTGTKAKKENTMKEKVSIPSKVEVTGTIADRGRVVQGLQGVKMSMFCRLFPKLLTY